MALLLREEQTSVLNVLFAVPKGGLPVYMEFISRHRRTGPAYMLLFLFFILSLALFVTTIYVLNWTDTSPNRDKCIVVEMVLLLSVNMKIMDKIHVLTLENNTITYFPTFYKRCRV